MARGLSNDGTYSGCAGDGGPNTASRRLAGQQDGSTPGAGLGDARLDELEPGQEARHAVPAMVVQVPCPVFGGELFAGVAVQMPGRDDQVASR